MFEEMFGKLIGLVSGVTNKVDSTVSAGRPCTDRYRAGDRGDLARKA